MSHFRVSVSLFVKIKKWDNKNCFVGSCKVGELESKAHHGHRVSVGETRGVTVTDGGGTTESTGSATSHHAYVTPCLSLLCKWRTSLLPIAPGWEKSRKQSAQAVWKLQSNLKNSGVSLRTDWLVRHYKGLWASESVRTGTFRGFQITCSVLHRHHLLMLTPSHPFYRLEN